MYTCIALLYIIHSLHARQASHPSKVLRSVPRASPWWMLLMIIKINSIDRSHDHTTR
uniref:Uncharacterized protein n=1 Tax=Setaria viridis TaxID=4556 RepID=A0A4U6UQA0_SETVI|nr:hypothetical protein SEVIR_5G446150v2 [Setaria viridis]